MMNRFRKLAATTILSAIVVFTATAAQAQECQPGIGPAFAANSTQFNGLIGAVAPELGNMFTALGALTDQATYETLLASANTAAAGIPTGRVVIALPDGTVVLDTARTDGDPAVPTSNTYAHFQAKTINENHNSRIAFMTAQQYPCGVSVESKLSTSTGQTEHYFALRLGTHLNSLGTVRISVQQ